MESPDVARAIDAAISIAVALDLPADDAIVLHNSNKLALRLLPCDVFARVAPVGHELARFEVELAQRLAETGSPVAALEPRVEPRGYERDGFEVTLWTYYEPVTPAGPSRRLRRHALERLHAGMRTIDVPTPHFTDRVADAQRHVGQHAGSSTTRTGSCSPARCGTCDEPSPTAAPPSSCCTASRTRATCSARSTGRCSSTSRRAAVGRSSSTSPMCPTRSASTTRASITRCSETAGSSSWRWSPSTAGIPATSSRTGSDRCATSWCAARGSAVADLDDRDAPDS